jgi:hypothetical protein
MLLAGSLQPRPLPAAKTGEWPLSGLTLVQTQWSSWVARFFATDDEHNLIYGRLIDQKPELQRVMRFRRRPDLVKHFPMSDGDLIVSVYNPEKYMQFVAFDFTGTLRYSNEFPLAYNVYDLDARVNIEAGNPSCLLYAFDKRNYYIKYWSELRTQDIMASRDPIELMLLQWADGGIHYVSASADSHTWTFWKNGEYRSFRLPFPIKHAKLYQYRNAIHLIGIDLEGGLWQFDISSGELRRNLLEKNTRFVLAEKVIPFNFNRELNIIVTGPHVATAYRLSFDDFPRPRRKPKLEERRLFWPGKFYPIIDRSNQLDFLLETEIRHIFFESWNAPTVLISDIDWRLDVKRNPPEMIVAWATPKDAQYAYRYLLDQNPDSEPLSDARLIPSNTLRFAARKEGAYVLHIQVRNLRTGSYSRVYHIPLVWQYAPPEPEIILTNQVAPRMVSPGRVDFLLKNPQPGEYYALIDIKPDTVPTRPVSVASGRLSFTVRAKGSYYLHLANRDPRSRVLSPVAHYLFFVSPFDAEEDPALAEHMRRIEEIRRIKIRIQNAKGDPAATQLWINRLQEIEAQLK